MEKIVFPANEVMWQLSEFNKVKPFLTDGSHWVRAGTLYEKANEYLPNKDYYKSLTGIIGRCQERQNEVRDSLKLVPDSRDRVFEEVDQDYNLTLVAVASGRRIELPKSIKKWYMEETSAAFGAIKSLGGPSEPVLIPEGKNAQRINELLGELEREDDLFRFKVLTGAMGTNLGKIAQGFQANYFGSNPSEEMKYLEELRDFSNGKSGIVCYDIKRSLFFSKEPSGIIGLREQK